MPRHDIPPPATRTTRGLVDFLIRRRKLANSLLLVLSTGFCVLTAELVLRLVLDPTRYLSPEIVRDEALGHRIRPGSAGHDAWGFRNRSVPERADVVALGDSQTYGHGVATSQSWPSVLGELTGLSVYNLSAGGYSPPQYSRLMESRALALKPELIVVGFNGANDWLGAFHTVHALDFWREFRDPAADAADAAATSAGPTAAVYYWSARHWLSRHSMIYRLVAHSRLADLLLAAESRAPSFLTAQEWATFERSDQGGSIVLAPGSALRNRDPRDPRVREGLELSCELLSAMQLLAERSSIRFAVVLIPSEESVVADALEEPDVPSADWQALGDAVAGEREINAALTACLRTHGVTYLDVLAPLKAAGFRAFHQTQDAHLTPVGHRILATEIRRFLIE